MSGRFPESDNVYEFRDNLFNKKDMVTENDKRWKLDRPDIPKRSAKIKVINKFDAGYFGLHYRQADVMDPALRILMETVIEAVMDAGINPLELKGSKTGVFVSVGWSNVENPTFVKGMEPQKFAVTGCLKSLYAHRLSYNLKLKGPSFTIDSASSSSANALHSAFQSMRCGECENAIVATCNLTLHLGTTIQFARLGVLSPDGVPKSFDQDGNGYVRGEACGCLFLQKYKNTKRIYAKIINVKVNSDGFKTEGLTFPSSKMQEKLMVEMYRESNINLSKLCYVEAHGTGTPAGDPEEVKAIDRALAKKCAQPLLVGSVKSNIGHTEFSSGFCSIIKVLIAMETGFIPPNINLKRIRKGLEGIEQNRMKVVTETTELLDHEAIVGVNNIGFGGNNCHIILQRFKKHKIDDGLPKDDVPRLICVSGRTNEAVLNILNEVSNKNLDEEYVGLLHQLYKINIPNHLYRGYAVVSKRGIKSMTSKLLPARKPHLHVFFGQFVNNFRTLASHLKNFSIFEDIETRINQSLVHYEIKTLKEILESRTKQDDDVLGSICIQLIMVDVMKHLELSPSGVFGDTYGKIVVAYYHNVIQLKEALANVIELLNLKYKELTNENFTKPVKRTILLNISDFPHNDDDILLVENGRVKLLSLLGRLYTEGYLPQVQKLYPQIDFPVSRNTCMISPFLQWNHENSWNTFIFREFESSPAEQKEYNISYLHQEHQFIKGHVVDGRNIFPVTEYLKLVWETFAQSRKLVASHIPVLFENCKFIRTTTVPESGYVKLLISIQRGTGNFEVLEKNSLLVSGRIQVCPNASSRQIDLPHLTSFSGDKLEILEQEQIYGELCQRGYKYSGFFKAIKQCNVDISIGLVKWENNWSAFMDNMIQMKILSSDTRLLYIPVGINKIIIDPLKHVEIAKSQDEQECILPVYLNEDSNMIKSGGIEILGLQLKSIPKKKTELEQVLEKHVFIPNNSFLELEQAVRINTQIILENNLKDNLKAVEIINEQTNRDTEPVLVFVKKALKHFPLVDSDLTISSKVSPNKTPGIKFEPVILTPHSNILLYIGSKLLQQPNTLKQLFTPLTQNGFILTREDVDVKVQDATNDIEILTDYTTPNERIILLRKKEDIFVPKFIEISSNNFEWLPELQKSLNLQQNIITFASNRDPEGILGLINCIRKETNGSSVKCFFMIDDAPEFYPQHPFYSKQISKNLAVNIYKDKSWGTYRNLLLEERPKIKCEHSYAHFKTGGGISSFEWIEGPLPEEVPMKQGQLLISTFYSSVNFKDVLAASGRANLEILQSHSLGQNLFVGFEFSGKDSSGRRIAGMTNTQGISSSVTLDSSLAWKVPDAWTLEDAATVPVVYSAVIYALLVVGDMKPGSSVLIHSATGGIGLAALNVCLHYKCDVYVTVGNQEKRAYLKENYPQIPDNHIGNSRNTSFEQMINRQTRSRGVDFILNSLSEDKRPASIRCLAQRGQLMEFGTYDLANDSALNLLLMEKNATYHGILLDIVVRNFKEMGTKVVKRLIEGIEAGFVKPLPRVVFSAAEIEKSYRYMMAGKHIGKILIKLRNEEEDNVHINQINKLEIMSNPRIHCNHRCTYVIIGGLGKVGLELSDWLIQRGARKLVLNSRSGIQNGYQQRRINIWLNGVEVKISTKNSTSEQGCEDLINQANELGPLDAIFILDGLFENLTEENFDASLARITLYLDRVTRKLCPKLRYFVIFSSLCCGHVNPGKINNNMANSVMERICESRKREGLPAVDIQWRTIGEVNLLGPMQIQNKTFVIDDTLQQHILSRLEMLDVLLNYDYPVVSSTVIAEKHYNSEIMYAVKAVARILGIKDMKTVSQYSTFPELGMDSMVGTEIINLLDKDFGIFVTPADLRYLTFARLSEVEEEKISIIRESVDNKKESTNLMVPKFDSKVDLNKEAPTVLVN
ncbi:hypothetical protein Zmor_018364 [Zophobas morio]|uniref:Uncharacterized protein n=1 Tax=Zophobas morio TaxID=2755281 RepID=A0AA38I9R9_9CUCU|nr:hypothetical protein Zmor_018364 [Zophobas morio]